MDNSDFAKLIPELPEWNNGKGIDIESWVCCVGNYEHAVGYSQLFWPHFVEYKDCIFHRNFSIESYNGFVEHCKGDRKPIESVINHRHVEDYFVNEECLTTATQEQLLFLGSILQQTWEAKLKRDFPKRKFVVSCYKEYDEKELISCQVTFHQKATKKVSI